MAREKTYNSRNGWIALSRDIERHWIWLDARRFQMWVQLLFLCQYQDSEVMIGQFRIKLKRGQFVTTISRLSSYLRSTRPTTYAFLQILEQSKMIKRENIQKITIVTVLNYTKYQPIFEDVNVPIVEGKKQDTLDRSFDTKLYTIKEKEQKNKKINNSSSSSLREENLKFFEEIKNTPEFWKQTSDSLGLSEKKLRDKAEKFFKERLAKEEFLGTMEEMRKYLFNWLRKAIELEANSQKQNQTIPQNGRTETDNRRGFDAPTPGGDELSKGIF